MAIKEIVDSIVHSTKSVADVTKAKVDISKKKVALNELFEELGRQTYVKVRQGEIDDEAFVLLCDRIDALEQEITQKVEVVSQQTQELKEDGSKFADQVTESVKGASATVVNVAKDTKDVIVDKIDDLKEKKENSDIVVEVVDEDLYFSDEDFPESTSDVEISYENTICSEDDEKEKNMCCGFGDHSHVDDDIDDNTLQKLNELDEEAPSTHVELERAPKNEFND